MKPPATKLSALVVSAIRNLREARGSTAKDIMNYITTEYNSGDSVIQRQMAAALKRGVEYGILRRQNGHYSLNGDPFFLNPQNMVPEDRGRRRRRRGRRSGRKRRGGRRGRHGRRRTRTATTKVRRRKPNRKHGMQVRHVKRRNDDVIENYNREELATKERSRAVHSPSEHRPADVEVPRRESSKGRERSSSRSRPSRSQQRLSSRQPSRQGSPTQSQSSVSSDQDDPDNRDD